MIARILTVIFCVLCVVSSPVYAWNATGHMLITKLAYDQLVPEAKAEVDRLMPVFTALYPNADNFITAAVWADDIRGHEITAFSNWHYVDIPIYENSNLPKISYDPHNVIWALNEAEKVLASKDTNAVERAVALSFYLHFMGDIHQPLHTATYVTADLPNGDKGGNSFTVKNFGNLHSLWDSAAGLFTSVARPLTPSSENELDRLAAIVSSLSGPVTTTTYGASAIAHEGNSLAKAVVYTDITQNTVPSSAYISRTQQVASKQVMLASKRLADRLNCILANAYCPKAA